MNTKNVLVRSALLITLTAHLSPLLAQGPLTPPGPPMPTMKSLVEVEPRANLQATLAPPGVVTTDANFHFIINQPGSYYLSANLGVTKTNGIQINAAGVTLDLNGFEISRIFRTGGSGIVIADTADRASVRNGTLRSFATGIGSSARAGAFRDLAVSGCTTSGISAGSSAVLESCRAHGNSGTGIITGSDSLLTNCIANNNGGLAGIQAGASSSLSHCSANENTGSFGIATGGNATLTNCSASHNTSADDFSGGIRADSGSIVSQCVASFNSSTAGTLTPSTGVGFVVSAAGSTIEGCRANFNKGDGIFLGSDALARNNTCDDNGSAGIRVTGTASRIEGNSVTDNSHGIAVVFTRNIIIKNTARENSTNYVIAAGNSYGTIVDDSGGGGAAVNGRSAGSTFGSPNAWANFSH